MSKAPNHINAFTYDSAYYASRFNLPDQVAKDFLESVQAHVCYVIEAGLKVGLGELHLSLHDESKFGQDEFPYYAMNFHGGSSPVDGTTVKDDFARAWLHHIHHNPHHWQHWIFADGFSPKGSAVESGVVEMPAIYVYEMVADWMGASRAYTGSWDMATWLATNLPKVRLHSRSWVVLKGILREQPYGYQGVLNELQGKGLIP